MRALLLALLARLPAAVASEPVTLVLEIDGLGSTEGQVLVALFASDDGFPGESDKAVRRLAVAPVAPLTRVTLEGLPPGRYAAVAVHDVNHNGVVDTRPVIPIPREPIATSRDPRPRLGPPRFGDAAFEVTGPRHVERFRMHRL